MRAFLQLICVLIIFIDESRGVFFPDAISGPIYHAVRHDILDFSD